MKLDPTLTPRVKTETPVGVPAGLVKCDKCGWSHAPHDTCVPDNSLSARYKRTRIALCELLPDARIDGYLLAVEDTIANYRQRLESAERRAHEGQAQRLSTAEHLTGLAAEIRNVSQRIDGLATRLAIVAEESKAQG